MKKIVILGLAVLMAGLFTVPAVAGDHEEGDHKKFHLHGEVRARMDYTENYLDLTDSSAAGFDDEYANWPFRVRVAAHGDINDTVGGYAEIQFADTFGSNGTPYFSAAGFAPIPFTQQQFGALGDLNLYQGYIQLNDLGGSGVGARIGRAEHTMGTELLIGDWDFYEGASFDGARIWWKGENQKYGGFYYKISESNPFFTFGQIGSSEDVNFWGVTGHWNVGDDGSWGNVEAYFLNLQDLVDNSSLQTLGGRWGKMVDNATASGHGFDWNVEYAMQSGEWGPSPFGPGGVGSDLPSCLGVATGPGCDFGGSIFEGWFGWNFDQGSNSRGRLHAGIFMTSGDDNPSDTDNDDFVGLFGDFHANNRLGDSEFIETLAFFLGGIHNITSYNIGYEAWIGNHYWMAALHQHSLTESAFLPAGFGDDLGQEINGKYGYQYTENVGFQIGIAQVSADDASEFFYGVAQGAGDDIRRVWMQVQARW